MGCTHCVDNAGELKQLFKEKERRKSGAGDNPSRTGDLSEGSHPAAVQGEAVPFWVDEESVSEDGGLELEDAVEGSEDGEVEETETKTEDRGGDRMSGELWEVLSREFLCIH